MTETFTEFDPADYLASPEAIVEFLTDALETGDAGYIDKAIGVVARAQGLPS
ncbi:MULTISPECIES: transcriptional regulator [Achromobacter]|jgi:probable addiction module antidote protein|uniref:helix-turn-helix domain-containing transcriptional regulator n=1 Tax=Achromobacter TaxID=222 RepID=UPI001AEF3E65|nr:MULTISPECIES: transcriptional regulator [Achromobacter]